MSKKLNEKTHNISQYDYLFRGSAKFHLAGADTRKVSSDILSISKTIGYCSGLYRNVHIEALMKVVCPSVVTPASIERFISYERSTSYVPSIYLMLSTNTSNV